MNDKPFEHTGKHGTTLTCKRCDFANVVHIKRPRGILHSLFAEDIAEIIGYHAVNILPLLTDFAGYDSLQIIFD
jgi:hypothetical protein